jgi:hypothetical protein
LWDDQMTRMTNQVMRIRLRYMPLDEALYESWYLSLAASADFLCAVGRDVARPTFGGVEGHDADGVGVLAGEQVLNDGLKVRGLDIGLQARPSRP